MLNMIPTINPFDADKMIEELTTYRDGLQQQLQVIDGMLSMAQSYKAITAPQFQMLQHNPMFQLWVKQTEEIQRFLTSYKGS